MGNVIQINNGSVYQKKQLILDNVSFEVKEGEFVYLIGKTGSGKSSILKTLYADLWLEKGTGTVAGFDLHKITKKEIPYLRRNIGIVFQDFQLLSDRTIENNFIFFMKAMGWKNNEEIRIRIHEVLNSVDLIDSLHKMPHQLSGGEQQRIGIARALVNRPKIILADEPTGNLDPQKSVEILNLFFKINQEHNTAVLMATHNLDLIERFPRRTLYCDKGELNELKENL